MKKINEIFVVWVTLLFLGLALLPSLNAGVLEINVPQFIPRKENFEEVTIYRFGPDGGLKSVHVNILLEEGRNSEEAITEKCRELYENDKELQQYIKSKVDSPLVTYVKAEGKGGFLPFRPIRLKNRWLRWRSLILYRFFYKNDSTYIRFNESQDWSLLLEGSQEIRLIGFTGYVNFQRIRLFRRIVIYGYALGFDGRTPKWPKNPWI